MLSDPDNKLANVMAEGPDDLKLAKPLVSELRILLTWSRLPEDELKGELRPPEVVEKRSLLSEPPPPPFSFKLKKFDVEAD